MKLKSQNKVPQEQQKQIKVSGTSIESNLGALETQNTEGFTRSGFVDQQQMHLSNSIRFADAKAGALITVCGLVIPQTLFLLESDILIPKILYIIALSLIAFGIFISFLVVLPTAKNSHAKGIIYWEHIQNYTQQEFVEQVKTMHPSKYMDYWLENNYIQAVILTKKFKYLTISFKCCLVAFVLSIVSFIWQCIG